MFKRASAEEKEEFLGPNWEKPFLNFGWMPRQIKELKEETVVYKYWSTFYQGYVTTSASGSAAALVNQSLRQWDSE